MVPVSKGPLQKSPQCLGHWMPTSPQVALPPQPHRVLPHHLPILWRGASCARPGAVRRGRGGSLLGVGARTASKFSKLRRRIPPLRFRSAETDTIRRVYLMVVNQQLRHRFPGGSNHVRTLVSTCSGALLVRLWSAATSERTRQPLLSAVGGWRAKGRSVADNLHFRKHQPESGDC